MNIPLNAAVLVIGDEILSGEIRDTNSATLAQFLAGCGIDLMEVRVVGDEISRIVAAVNALRSQYRYVFTTGGIGPTHDDKTADAMGAAFGVAVDYHPVALEMLHEYYKNTSRLNESRRRMARIPQGASLIKNPVSGAPGFQIGNVFVMAGVPNIMKAMLEDIKPRLEIRSPVQKRTIVAQTGEGTIAGQLAAIQSAYPDVAIGSYPGQMEDGRYFVRLVARSRDDAKLNAAADALENMFNAIGVVTGVRPSPDQKEAYPPRS